MIKWATVYWSLAALGGLYAIFVSLLLNPQLQRFALYAHHFHTAWWHNINRPEQFGFTEGQATPFRISTADGESLFAWHILPLALYAKESNTLGWEERPARELSDYSLQRGNALATLRRLNSRLVINFHGNAGHLAQGWRTRAYKAMASADPNHIHVLTFDYRGFGNSTGSPTEAGLIQDGIAVVNWALNIAKVEPSNILLVGQSLGTAVATAVLEHFADHHREITFAGLLLSSGFADLPTLLQSYAIGGFIPILYPMKPYPPLLNFFSERIADTWNTTSRLTRLAVKAQTMIRILHARNDFDIGWKHSNALFDAVLEGMAMRVEECPSWIRVPVPLADDPQMELAVQSSKEIFSHKIAYYQCLDSSNGRLCQFPNQRASRTITFFGGHNGVLESNYAALAIKELFDASVMPA